MQMLCQIYPEHLHRSFTEPKEIYHMTTMNLKITPTVCALVSTPDGTFVRCTVEMVLSPYQLMPMYQAEAIEGRPFDGQRKVIVPFTRVSFVSLKGQQPHA
jgi:hypothetical protein